MSRNRKIGKSFFQIIIALIIFFLLFFVDLDYLEDKCTFLRIFKLNVNWLEQLIESYTSLFILTVVVAFIIWAMFTLSISVKGVSFGVLLCNEKNDAMVELTLPEDSNIYASQYKLYLPDKKLLQDKLKEWLQEEGGAEDEI